jgi:hypothetical protein
MINRFRTWLGDSLFKHVILPIARRSPGFREGASKAAEDLKRRPPR